MLNGVLLFYLFGGLYAYVIYAYGRTKTISSSVLFGAVTGCGGSGFGDFGGFVPPTPPGFRPCKPAPSD